MSGLEIENGPVEWVAHEGYEDVRYETSEEGIARITIARPEVHNAFRPRTVEEMMRAFAAARDDASIGVVVRIPDPRGGVEARSRRKQ